MQHLSDLTAAHEFVWRHRLAGRTVGLVPTMGALHEGHLSLVRQSVETCDVTVATIFVNPTQFAPTEDLAQYPRTLDADCAALESGGAAAVFLPTQETMYREGFSTFVGVPEVGKTLEGICRPTHFQGVTTVVMKLFQILPASHAFFGRKDYQQWCVIRAMVEDLNVPMEILSGETVREADGLALSSRNRYLSAEDRPRALLISKALERVAHLSDGGERRIEILESEMRRVLLGGNGIAGVDKIDYAVVVDPVTLAPLAERTDAAVALIAAYVGGTRLIDNRVLENGS